MKFHAGHNYGLTRITPYQDNKQYTAHRVFSWSRFPWNCWAFESAKKSQLNLSINTSALCLNYLCKFTQVSKWWNVDTSDFLLIHCSSVKKYFFDQYIYASQRKSSQHLLRHKTHIWSKTQWQKTDVESALLMNVHIYKILTAFETVPSLICQVKL